MNNQGPITGVGVMIFKEGNALFGKRKGSHGAGEWGFPGGKVELGESWKPTLIRETREETGIEIYHPEFICLANIKQYIIEGPSKHYTHLGYRAFWKFGEARVIELEKCEEWIWRPLWDYPEPLFIPTLVTIASYIEKKPFYDHDDVEEAIRNFKREFVKDYFAKRSSFRYRNP